MPAMRIGGRDFEAGKYALKAKKGKRDKWSFALDQASRFTAKLSDDAIDLETELDGKASMFEHLSVDIHPAEEHRTAPLLHVVPPQPTRRRRTPEQTTLYQVVADNLETFFARVDNEHRSLPHFVRKELRNFLDCGILSRGFARVHCSSCGKDELVAFSCKGRGFCPACGARRMHDTAAWLVDRVLPWTPVRQWVLALPHRVRFLCAFDPELCRGVRKIFVRAITSFCRRRAKQRGIEDPRAGCVAVTQRFDSALRLNVHFHTIWPDGVFTCPPGCTTARFHPDEGPLGADIEKLAVAVGMPVTRHPPHRSRRAELPHRAPAAGQTRRRWLGHG